MEIVTWVLFVIIALVALLSTVLIYAYTSEDDADESVWLHLLNYILICLTFYLSKELFSPIISIWIWKGGNIFSVINLIICSIVRRQKIGTIWIITLIASLNLALIPFTINVNFTKSESIITILKDLNNNYPSILITFWLPILCLIIISFLLYYFVSYRNKTQQNSLFKLLIEKQRIDSREKIGRNYDNDESKYTTDKERRRLSSFEEKNLRKLYEELQYRFDNNFKKYDDLYFKQRDLFEAAYSRIIEPRQITRNVITQDNNNIIELAKSVNEIKHKIDILNKDHPSNINLYSNSNNQNFIRELHHFLITPLSQIESKAIIFNQNPKILFENEAQFTKAVSTIKISVEICKSVLAAYRELAFVTSSSDWSLESLNQSVIAAGNLYKESMEKEVNIISDLGDNFQPYSNNYLLAVLLPLIENAIKASPPNKNIQISYLVVESRINILIENEAINMPTLRNLNTPGFSSKKNHKGTGLLIARHLVEDQNKGTINFEIKENLIITTVSIPKSE